MALGDHAFFFDRLGRPYIRRADLPAFVASTSGVSDDGSQITVPSRTFVGLTLSNADRELLAAAGITPTTR